MINYFIVFIRGKNIKYVLREIFKLKINIYDIKYLDNGVLLKVSYEDYKKIKNIKTSCSISIVKTSGKKRFYDLFVKYKISIITFIISFLLCLFLSCFTLFIDVDTSSNKMKSLIISELKNNGITIFSLKKSYFELEKIKSNIKNNNLDSIEWIEIENKGVVTRVKIIERVNNSSKENNSLKDIVASKNGYIRKIVSSKGEVLKNTDDYVKKGEVIISGNIIRNDKVVKRTHAKGKVYAEVWYIVKTSKSFNYVKDSTSDDGYFSVIVNILGNDFCIFKVKKDIDYFDDNKIFNSDLFSISFRMEKIHYKTFSKYSDRELSNILSLRARDSILENLDNDEYIISQKTLKKYQYNGKMYVEIFFKTYEDIALEKDIQKIEEKKDEE